MSEAEQIVAGYAALSGAHTKTAPGPEQMGGKGLIFAPHPDDECIVAALPLRLQREAGLDITVVPVTLGSKTERRAERREELAAACAVLGFTIADLAAQGLSDVNPVTRSSQPIYWDGMVGKVAQLISRLQPTVLFVPHRLDGHATHIGTHHIVLEALARQAADFTAHVAFTEFWQPQADPNLLVECSPEDLTRIVTGLMCHRGEVARNPYHRTLPAWMIDNARRGAEVVGGFGAQAEAIGFATLYQFGLWAGGDYRPVAADILLPADHSAASLFKLAA